MGSLFSSTFPDPAKERAQCRADIRILQRQLHRTEAERDALVVEIRERQGSPAIQRSLMRRIQAHDRALARMHENIGKIEAFAHTLGDIAFGYTQVEQREKEHELLTDITPYHALSEDIHVKNAVLHENLLITGGEHVEDDASMDIAIHTLLLPLEPSHDPSSDVGCATYSALPT